MIMTYPFLLLGLLRKIPWQERKVDIVLECTGLFTNAEKAKGHFSNNVKKF